MHSARLVLLAACSLLAAACGTFRAGDSCDQAGFVCADGTTVLECRAGSWVALPCKGPEGCQREGDKVKCDMSLNGAGDLCASTVVGKGLCTADKLGVLECRDDGTGSSRLVRLDRTCRSCVVSAATVVCQP